MEQDGGRMVPDLQSVPRLSYFQTHQGRAFERRSSEWNYWPSSPFAMP